MAEVEVDDSRDHVRVVTLNRPERMNALDGTTLAALQQAVISAANPSSDIRVIVIRGRGRAFCSGNDLKWLAESVLSDPAAHMAHQDRMQETYQQIAAAPQAVIASINGFALAGGFELALACDIVLADEAALMGDEDLRRNLLPSGGSSQRLPRKIGPARALYYLLTGRRMTGLQAAEMGLVAKAVPAEALEKETLALAEEIAVSEPMALAAMKEMVRQGMELPLSDALSYERWMQHRYRTRSPALEASVRTFAAHDT